MEYLSNLLKENPSSATRSVHNISFTFPVRYYDFHVYYFAHDKSSSDESDSLRDRLLNEFQEDCSDGSIIVKKLPNDKVIGPHPTQFWEADVCRPEVFVKVLSWFQLHHGNLSVLIHPQSGNDLADHTTNALWLGERLPLLTNKLPQESLGIPEFGIKGGSRIPAKDFSSHVPILK
ncbi:uncharacterized protein PRCAT00005345001 [Priceomyces carsonii]|uniref:uncharacterized protein n=1 Tax=Priceomyces carsonii TaxID=28549 RepID=UPI002EDACE3A|nr:unnamed protein product [Priceomyces carsonii]